MALDSALNRWVDGVPEHREASEFPFYLNATQFLYFLPSPLGIRGFKDT